MWCDSVLHSQNVHTTYGHIYLQRWTFTNFGTQFRFSPLRVLAFGARVAFSDKLKILVRSFATKNANCTMALM